MVNFFKRLFFNRKHQKAIEHLSCVLQLESDLHWGVSTSIIRSPNSLPVLLPPLLLVVVNPFSFS